MKKRVCEIYKVGTMNVTYAFTDKVRKKTWSRYQGSHELTDHEITLLRLAGYKIVEPE